MQHDTTTCNMIQQHTTRWSNGTNFFFTTNVACCCMKSWDRLTGALSSEYYPQLMAVALGQMRKLGDEFGFETVRHGPALSGEEQIATETELVTVTGDPPVGIINVTSSFDYAPSLKIEKWPKLADTWGKRYRKWPPRQTIDHILQSECHIVAVPSHTSKNPNIEWRLSFSYAEKVLTRKMTSIQRQVYIFVKYLLWKSFICKEKELPTYYLKTAFLWLLEELDTLFWNEDNFASAVMLLLEKVSRFLMDRNYPNYFIPENNMIDHMENNIFDRLLSKICKVSTDMVLFLSNFPQENQRLILEKEIFSHVFGNIIPHLQVLESDRTMDKFDDQKNPSLLKMAKVYQSFEAADFAVQVYA